MYPLIEPLTLPLPAELLFESFKGDDHAFFLDSGMDPQRLGRYSFVGSQPFLIMKSRGNVIKLTSDGHEEVIHDDPFNVVRELLNRYSFAFSDSPVPFMAGAVGYLSYDLCHFIERLPSTAIDDLQLPECYLAFYDSVIAIDNLKGQAYIISTGLPEKDADSRNNKAAAVLKRLKKHIKASSSSTLTAQNMKTSTIGKTLGYNFKPGNFKKAVQKTREYIIAGDIFQANISQRFDTSLDEEPYALYHRLRKINPAPFAAYLNFDELKVVSASPERFLKVEGDMVETRPIKGTRPRGKNPEQDMQLAQQLLSSIKDRAENTMIVDLERNDLGRVCKYGSIKVTELGILEKFPTVFHLTSTITGQLQKGKDRIDLLKATFPGGSITGAPKVRAMEIIDELEPTRRSVYTGSIGYISFHNTMDLNIAIRTILIKNNRAYFQVGGGIVYDSEPESEYQETLDKASALAQSLNIASEIGPRSK